MQIVPAGINFFSPFSSLDLRHRRETSLGEHARISLMGEGFKMFNETMIRGSSAANFSGRNITTSPYVPARSWPPPVLAQAGQANFYSAVGTPGGFLGSGGPRASQFAARADS